MGEVVAVEDQHSRFYQVAAQAEEIQGQRREQHLVIAYCGWMRSRGSTIGRLRIPGSGSGGPLYCDIYDQTRRNLIEAKGLASRSAVRMAIGELADYQRAGPEGTQLGGLLPERPHPDLQDLLRRQGIAVIWQDGSEFWDDANGTFV